MNEGADFRIGILGTGAIAQVVHLPTLTQMRGVSVAAVCDPDESKTHALARRFEVPTVYETDEELLRDETIDGVVICTPSHLHEEHSIRALQAGKHVLVEKPLGLTAAGADRVVRAAREADRTLMVALNSRYRADTNALKPFLDGGELGEVFYLRAGSLNRKVRVVRPTWRHRKETAGGGAIMDLGVQTLDLCLWMLDYPEVERVLAHTHPGERMEVEDSAAITVKLTKGPVISVQLTWSLFAQKDQHYLDILGSQGSATLAPFAVFKEVEHGLLDVTPQLPPGRANFYTVSYRQQLAHFVDAAQGEREAGLPEEQVELMRLIELAYRSAESRREVRA